MRGRTGERRAAPSASRFGKPLFREATFSRKGRRNELARLLGAAACFRENKPLSAAERRPTRQSLALAPRPRYLCDRTRSFHAIMLSQLAMNVLIATGLTAGV